MAPIGLTLFPSHPFLVVSGDGKIEDMSEGPENKHGVLEIKCPHSINGQVIHNMEVYDIVEKLPGKQFCLEMPEEGLRLKRDHKYYAQVQGVRDWGENLPVRLLYLTVGVKTWFWILKCNNQRQYLVKYLQSHIQWNFMNLNIITPISLLQSVQ